MAKKPTLHPYADLSSFQRLLLLIALLLQNPGIGSTDPEPNPPAQNSLQNLQKPLQQLATQLGIDLPTYSTHTLRKDLVTLRRYGILDQHMFRWGYYLGTAALNREELQLAINALASQAINQGDPRVRQTYHALKKRLKGLDLELKGELFYPVRTHLNRAIMHTDPEEMMAKRENRNTLFHRLEELENAIIQGQAIELYQARTPYTGKPSYRRIYPLQLLYYDIAWYLVMEDQADGHLAISRLDRFNKHLKILIPQGRGLQTQQQSLQTAHKLLESGWGLNLGNHRQDQQMELQGKLPLTTCKVRFFPPIATFIEEGERRHPKQTLTPGPKDPETGNPLHLDYSVKLPERSLNEFGQWVNRYMQHAQVLAPPQLVEQHRQGAQALALRYSSPDPP